jgi:hypothetical protein
MSEVILDSHQYTPNNALHDFTLIKLIFARLVGTGVS